MPVQTTYPGVYIEEISSGVRTITGVSTSTTAFFGQANKGPINKSVLITSYTDYENIYGGISRDFELGYSVYQYFLNGGTTAIISRLAKNPQIASEVLEYIDSGTNDDALNIEAKNAGSEGNNIKIEINYQTADNFNEFNLLVHEVIDGEIVDTETHLSLSMNSLKSNFVGDIDSKYINVKKLADDSTKFGTLTSGDINYGASSLDDSNNNLSLEINGYPVITISIDETAATLADVAADIQSKVVSSANGIAALEDFTCTEQENSLVLKSGEAGQNSYVIVHRSSQKDASSNLRLTKKAGAEQRNAAGILRPIQYPSQASFIRSDTITAAPSDFITLSNRSFKLSLDNQSYFDVVLDEETPLTGSSLSDRITEIAERITEIVQELKLNDIAFSNFKCTADGGKLTLTSGKLGYESTIQVKENGSDTLLDNLQLNQTDAEYFQAEDTLMSLKNGFHDVIDEASLFSVYLGNRAKREGLYTLESQDIFNLMVLPGVRDFGVLAAAAAYCEERRAFLIVDSPQNSHDVTAMKATIENGDIPSSDYSGVYFPWLSIPDPLQGGSIVNRPPSGTIAGLYARTDTERGVWKSPAGTDATLRGVKGLSYQMTDLQNGMLNTLGVNCIRKFPVYGTISWGARTLDGANAKASEWKYIPVRRTALYIEESLYQGLAWVVFEGNDASLWAQIRLNVGAFMHNMFRQGAFQGKKKEAYFVKCDSETTTQNDINSGIVNIVVGFAPVKPAEYVILKIQQIAGDIET